MAAGQKWIVWTAAMLIAALLAVQPLRMRAAEAAVRAYQPWGAAVRPQNAWAQSLAAEALLDNGDAAGARARAAEALRLSTLDVRAMRLLATVRDREKPGSGTRFWQLASSIGWRDLPTQMWAFRQALLNGDFAVMAARADAFLRGSARRPLNEQLLRAVRGISSQPAARKPIVERLLLHPAWRESFFWPAARLSDAELQGTIAVIEDLGRSGDKPSRTELHSAMLQLIDGKRFTEALQLDRRFVGRRLDSGSLLDDGAFGKPGGDYERDVTPFDWSLIAIRGGVYGTFDIAGDGYKLTVVNDQGYADAVISRYIALAPGTYRLAYDTAGGTQSPRSIALWVICAATGAILTESAAADLQRPNERRSVDFRFTPDCQLARILIGSRASPVAGEAQFDNFTLAPLRSSAAPTA